MIAAVRGVVVGAQADVRTRVPRGVQNLDLDGGADLNGIARLEAHVDAGNRVLGAGVRQQLRAGRGEHRGVAAGVSAVFVGIEDLGDLPAFGFRTGEAELRFQRIHGQRLAALGTGDR